MKQKLEEHPTMFNEMPLNKCSGSSGSLTEHPFTAAFHLPIFLLHGLESSCSS